jgi:hypothetical protein
MLMSRIARFCLPVHLFWSLLLSGVASADAQEELPVVRANSPHVDVRDGDRLFKGGWEITPAVPLDIYVPRRSDEPVTVTFITDVESRSFVVRPGEKVDFVFLLNGRDRCRTQLWTKERPARRAPETPLGPITIPFTFIDGKPFIQARINDSSILSMLFDTGAATTVINASAIEKGVAPTFDGTVLNVGTGGAVERQTASDNRIAIAGLYWEHESVLALERIVGAGDGIIGINIFDGKVVEVDYERMVLVIHDDLPEHAASFISVPIAYDGTLLTVDGTFGTSSGDVVVPMVINTGGTGALMGNALLADVAERHEGYKVLGSAYSSGVGPRRVAMKVLSVPEFSLAGHQFLGIPMHVPSQKEESDVPAVSSDGPRGTLCLDVLSKFNMMLDFKNHYAYFRPNSRIDDPIRWSGGGLSVAVWIAMGSVSMCALAYVRLRRRKAQREGVRPTGPS